MENKWMQVALLEANKGFAINEVPIGAVIIYHDQIIGYAHNMREISQNAIYHAEIIAIQEACDYLHSWRLDDCDMYVTIEPCLMCAGAILNARIKNLYYGAPNYKFGAIDSLYHVLSDERLNHQVTVKSGIKCSNAANLMKLFFRNARKKHQKNH